MVSISTYHLVYLASCNKVKYNLDLCAYDSVVHGFSYYPNTHDYSNKNNIQYCRLVVLQLVMDRRFTKF